MRDVAAFIHDEITAGNPVVCAVIVSSTGSTPRSTGSRMAVLKNGACHGSVGGGASEAMTQNAVPLVFQTGESQMLRFDLTGGEAADAGMICGGRMEILLQYIPPENGSITLWGRISRRQAKGKPCTLITAFEKKQGEKQGKNGIRILFQGTDARDLPKPVAGPVLGAMGENENTVRHAHVLNNAGTMVLIEPLSPPGRLIIAGGGHVGAATAYLAAQTGFYTLVMDDRTEFVSEKRFPTANERLLIPGFQDCLSGLEPGPDDMVVILTRGHLHDRTVLAQALQTRAGYIGMIGSRSKRDTTYNDFLQQGIHPAELERIACPIGIDIGAQTPEEIAVSIIAQLIAHRSGRLAQ